MEIKAPGIQPGGGSILENTIASIKAADRVLVITDRPNANVGFELGLALGLGKPTLFAFNGAELPSWCKTPPLGNYVQAGFDGVEELQTLLLQPERWVQLAKPAPLATEGECCFLCPQRGEGAALRAKRVSQYAQWSLPPEHLLLSDLATSLGKAARIVWTIAPFAEGSSVRDGEENAANAIIAGWFYSRCLEREKSSREARFNVLRLKPSRPVVDVEPLEKSFERLGEFAQLLVGVESRWKAEVRDVVLRRVDERVDSIEQLAVRTKPPFVADYLRRDVADARESIDRVNYYKRIHDTLHQIQFRCYMPLVHSEGFASGTATDLGSLDSIRIDLKDWIAKLEGIAPDSVIAVERPTWEIERLRLCVDDLGVAIEHDDAASLSRAVVKLGRVMDRSPGIFGSLLAAAAQGLGVRRLVAALLPLRAALAGSPSEAAVGPAIEGLEADLAALEAEQSSLIDRHCRWEKVEAGLKMIDAALKDVSAESVDDADLWELRTQWPFLRGEAEKLVGLGAETLAENLKKETERVDLALQQQDLAGCLSGYLGFRNVAAKIFLKVDTSLKDLCSRLAQTGKRLESCLITVEKVSG